jgi:hypothetical protein
MDCELKVFPYQNRTGYARRVYEQWFWKSIRRVDEARAYYRREITAIRRRLAALGIPEETIEAEVFGFGQAFAECSLKDERWDAFVDGTLIVPADRKA